MVLMTAFLLSLASTEDCVFYRTPENAAAEDVTRSAQAMAARCKNYGYKGIHTTVVERDGRKLVQVLCDGGLTPEMKATIDLFAGISGSAIELRFPVVLTDIEKQQYRPGAKPSEDKAPPGMRWFRFRSSEDAPVLLKDEFMSKGSEIQMRTQKESTGKTKTYWDISLLQTRELQKAEIEKLGHPYLVGDGWALEAVVLNTLEKNEEGKIVPAQRFYFTPKSAILQEALIAPMPFPLQNEDTPTVGR